MGTITRPLRITKKDEEWFLWEAHRDGAISCKNITQAMAGVLPDAPYPLERAFEELKPYLNAWGVEHKARVLKILAGEFAESIPSGDEKSCCPPDKNL